MRIAEDGYLSQLQALLPPGMAWTRERASNLARLLSAFAAELARLDGRAHDLVEEADPRTAVELVADWERLLGLPDPCAGQAVTLQERRERVVQKLTTLGGQSRAYFIAVAAALGFAITIEEFRPFRASMSSAGDPVCDEDWWFVWRVHGPEQTIRDFRVSASVTGEPLRNWGNQILECVLARLKPAHTLVQFAYGS